MLVNYPNCNAWLVAFKFAVFGTINDVWIELNLDSRNYVIISDLLVII